MTILPLPRTGLYAKPTRGEIPHCLPVSVEFVTPAVGDSLLLPRTIKPFDVTILELSSN